MTSVERPCQLEVQRRSLMTIMPLCQHLWAVNTTSVFSHLLIKISWSQAVLFCSTIRYVTFDEVLGLYDKTYHEWWIRSLKPMSSMFGLKNSRVAKPRAGSAIRQTTSPFSFTLEGYLFWQVTSMHSLGKLFHRTTNFFQIIIYSQI